MEISSNTVQGQNEIPSESINNDEAAAEIADSSQIIDNNVSSTTNIHHDHRNGNNMDSILQPPAQPNNLSLDQTNDTSNGMNDPASSAIESVVTESQKTNNNTLNTSPPTTGSRSTAATPGVTTEVAGVPTVSTIENAKQELHTMMEQKEIDDHTISSIDCCEDR